MIVLENLLDPAALVMDGRLPSEILEALARTADERYEGIRPERPDRPRMALRTGSHGAEAVAFGAATLPLYLATAADLALVR